MSLETSYTEARANLAELCDRAAEDRQTIIIRRRGHEDVALVSAAELSSLNEAAHLLRSPANRQRLLRALRRAGKRQGRAQTVEQLRREVGLER
jgi:antitoxin YefM